MNNLQYFNMKRRRKPQKKINYNANETNFLGKRKRRLGFKKKKTMRKPLKIKKALISINNDDESFSS